MNKTIIAIFLSLALAFGASVTAQAYILPGFEEIPQTDGGQSTVPANPEVMPPAPVTPAPVTPAPVTPQPATPVPTTPAPSVTEPSVPVIAIPVQPPVQHNNSGEPRIAFDGVVSQTVIPILLNDTMYVSFRAYCLAVIEGAEITWDYATNTSRCESPALNIDVPIGENYIIANGRVLYRNDANLTINDTLYVPVRSLAVAIGARVEWNDAEQCAYLYTTGEPIVSGDKFYNQTDLLWLARIINAESKHEPLLGKIAVGNVVLNRVASSDFPDTVYDVLFDCRYSVQFYPVNSPVINNTPTEDCIIAAKVCLEGFSVSKNILYFMNPKLAVSTWISRNRSFVFKIGNHSFYA